MVKGMKNKQVFFGIMLFIGILLSVPSCITEKEMYQSASGEKELPKWRLLARAREAHGPYIQWKEGLIKELYAGSKMIDTKKGPIEYAIQGDSGPYLMVMHGGPGGYDQTAALFSDMFDKGFRVLSWSRPGYIRTPLEVAKTFEDQADAAIALLDALHIDRVAVLGYSAGGPPAIYFSSRYPGRTWALILECAVSRKWVIKKENIEENIYFGYLMYQDPFLWTSDVVGTHAPRMIGMSTIEMESSLDKAETEKLMDNIMKDPERVKVLTGMMKSMSPGDLREAGMKNDVEQLEKVKDLPLKDIKTPTLIIHGTKDADVSVADAEFSASQIPGSELFLVPGGFHVMAITDSIDTITQKRVDFLKEHSPH
ncbi:MAG: alpha/beta hydrolase [Desulfobacteraceae bacterium]|nr:MAG: alpha/beta hydrolase [Desulfobacteraceae bacterium]